MRLMVCATPMSRIGWLTARIGVNPTGNFRAIEAVDPTGRIHGMVGYDSWTENSVMCHIAIESPAALRAFLSGSAPAFDYPFNQEKRGVMLGTVSSKNAKALKLNSHLGFVEIGRIKDGFSVGEDIVLLELRKENCRWIGKQERRAA